MGEKKEFLSKISKDFLGNIINGVGDPIFVKNDKFEFVLVNDALCKFLGITEDQIMGKTLKESLPPDQMEHFFEIDKSVFDSGVENTCEELITVHDGLKTIVTKKTRYVDEEGNKFLIGVIHDITLRKKSEEALEDYVNMINHDLRNPLASIIGFTQLIHSGEDYSTDEMKQFIDIIFKLGRRMMKMVETYLLLSKIDRGLTKIDKKERTILQVISAAESIFHNLNSKINLKIRLMRPGTIRLNLPTNLLNERILINEELFESLLINLMANAVEASHLNESNEIDLFVYEEASHIYFSIFNKGEISEIIQEKLFHKYSTSKKNGNGLGLYSAKIIAIAHNGDLFHQSFDGGTMFTIKLPLLK